MIALLDADIVCYRVAAAYENEDLELAKHQADSLVDRLLHETGASTGRLFLSGADNFRYKVNPEYKANRKDVPKPRHLEDLREHLVVTRNATVSEGCEADDLMGIAQCNTQEETVIVSLDKDLLMIPGNHYSWEISGKTKDGMWTRPALWSSVTEVQGYRHFCKQMLLGDRTDNVFGFDGLARSKFPNKFAWMEEFLDATSNEQEMIDFVKERYDNVDRYLMNYACLWILREELVAEEEGNTPP